MNKQDLFCLLFVAVPLYAMDKQSSANKQSETIECVTKKTGPYVHTTFVHTTSNTITTAWCTYIESDAALSKATFVGFCINKTTNKFKMSPRPFEVFGGLQELHKRLS